MILKKVKPILITLFLGSYLFSFSQSNSIELINIDNDNCLPIKFQCYETAPGNPRGYLWDFGNGKKSNQSSPKVSYTSSGNYQIKLVVVYDNSTISYYRNVYIPHNPNANFTTANSRLCKPDSVDFQIADYNPSLLYQWNFDDSTETITPPSSNLTHFFNHYGIFEVELKVVNENGCMVSQKKRITVEKPNVEIHVSQKKGCVPQIVEIRAENELNNTNIITNFLWNFGDSSSLNTYTNSVEHSYVRSGIFFPTLTIFTNNGCSNIYEIDSLKFGNPPINQTSVVDNEEFCASQPQHFISKADNADEYKWKIGNDIIYTSDTSIEYQFRSLGIHKIKITPYSNGCKGESDSFLVKSKGVISKFKFHNYCSARDSFQFIGTSIGNISYQYWDFGDHSISIDNNIISIDNNIVYHLYQNPGVYHVKLHVSDVQTGCVDSLIKLIYVDSLFLFNYDDTLCQNTPIQFNLSTNYPHPNAIYKWHLLGNTPFITRNNEIEVKAKQFGIFQNFVVVNNGNNYCKDTIYLNHNLLVRGGDVDFNIPTELCRNESFLPVNITHSFLSIDSIVEYEWKINNQLYSNEFQPNAYYFQDEGTYQIKLSGTDNNGCMDSITKQMMVHPEPFLWNIPQTKTICEDQQTRIIAYTSDSIYWKILPDIILCESCDTIYQQPHLTTTYFSIAKNEYGCRNKDSSYIIVLNPFHAQILNTDTSICSGDTMQLTVIPNHKIVNWYPNTSISDIQIPNPYVYPKVNSYYKVELSDSLDCFDSKDSIFIKLKQPVWVDAGQDIILPFQSTYILMPNYSNNVINYLWSPLHDLSCSQCPNPSIEINKSSTYHIKVTSDSGCVAKDDISIFIECESVKILMPNAFTPNNDGLNDFYKPYNRGINRYLEFCIYNKMGQKIYEKKNFTINESNVGWNGTFKGKEQNTGTYIYIIQAVCDSGKQVTSKGSFLLLR